jgi:hypothetical protein
MTITTQPTLPDDAERAVMVCPQCEGEGGYPDGLDADACHTECTRCGSNGWIVNLAVLNSPPLGKCLEARGRLLGTRDTLAMAVGTASGTRVTLHLTRAKQMLAVLDDLLTHIGKVQQDD